MDGEQLNCQRLSDQSGKLAADSRIGCPELRRRIFSELANSEIARNYQDLDREYASHIE